MPRSLSTVPARQGGRSNAPTEIDDPLKFLYDSGLLFEANRVLFHPVGLSMQVRENSNRMSMVLLDCSKNPTVTFDRDVFIRGRAKWQEWKRRFGIPALTRRQQLLGITTQTEPDYRQQSTSKG